MEGDSTSVPTGDTCEKEKQRELSLAQSDFFFFFLRTSIVLLLLFDSNTTRVPSEAGADEDETEDEANNERNSITGIEGSNSLGLKGNSQQGKAKGLGGKRLGHAIEQRRTKKTLKGKLGSGWPVVVSSTSSDYSLSSISKLRELVLLIHDQ